MSSPERHQPPEHAKVDMFLVHDPVDAEALQVALRQHHQERLRRLFRHVGDSADDHYLLGIMRRYRELEPL